MKQIELVFAGERQPKPPTQFGKEFVKYNKNDKKRHIPDRWSIIIIFDKK